jgi:type IV pilus assembly protein PilF
MRILIVLGISTLLLACTSAQQKEEDLKIAQTNVQLSAGYLEQGNLKVALVKVKRALEADPDYAPAQSIIALIYYQMKEYDKSKQHYERALELEPESGDIHNNYATLLCKMGKPKEAEEHYLKAINSRGYRTPAQALGNLGTCLMQIPDYEKAEKYLRMALQMNPRSPGALFQMARISVEKGRYMSGRAYLERFQEVSKMTPESLWLGIKVERKLGDKHAIMNYKTRLIRDFPNSKETRLLLKQEENGLEAK